MATAIVAGAIALVTFGVLLARHESGDGSGAAPTVVVTSTAPARTTTRSVPSTSPTTSRATSTTRSSSTSTTVADIIPGFPATKSIDQFVVQLQRNPLLVGDAGPRLLTALNAVLDTKSPKKRAEAAAALRRSVAAWSKDGSLNADIAAAIDALLSPIATR
jgi:hypothetical protein